jgi:transposase
MMSDLYWLTDEQMARFQPYFPKSHGRERVDDRRVLSGIIFVNRNGFGSACKKGPRSRGDRRLKGTPHFDGLSSGLDNQAARSGCWFWRQWFGFGVSMPAARRSRRSRGICMYRGR